MKTTVNKTPPEKLDLLKEHAAVYVTPKSPVLLEVPAARYLAIAGNEAPGGRGFEESVGALYAMAFTIKMTRKFSGLGDYAISKLEAVYPEMGFTGKRMAELSWNWRLLIRTPEFVGEQDLEKALSALRKKGNEGLSPRVRLETLEEGLCVQLLHVGPYEAEALSFERMQSFAEAKGLSPSGPHHEIYISDPRRVEPAKLKTILRLPVRKSA